MPVLTDLILDIDMYFSANLIGQICVELPSVNDQNIVFKLI